MSKVDNPKSENWFLKSTIRIWCTKSDEIRSLMSDVCPKTVWIMSKIWSTTYICSKPGVQKPKSEVQSMSEVQNPSLKPKSEVCKSETEVQILAPKFEVWS